MIIYISKVVFPWIYETLSSRKYGQQTCTRAVGHGLSTLVIDRADWLMDFAYLIEAWTILHHLLINFHSTKSIETRVANYIIKIKSPLDKDSLDFVSESKLCFCCCFRRRRRSWLLCFCMRGGFSVSLLSWQAGKEHVTKQKACMNAGIAEQLTTITYRCSA